jgi:large subunit ribosomal protein L17
VERLITKARRLGNVAFEKAPDGAGSASRLNVSKYLESELGRFGVRIEKGGESVRVDLVEKVLIELAARYSTRPGGYTRIVRLGARRGDGAPQAVIELVPGA